MESANKLVVEARLKGAGMRWAEAQVNPMVALRNIVCSDRWEEAWPQRATRLRQQAAQGESSRDNLRHGDERVKVLLVNPPYLPEERYGKLAAFGPTNEPLELAYIAGSLEAAGVEVRIADAPALRLGVEEIGNWLVRDRFDLVGVTMLTPMYHRSLEILRRARKDSPAIRTVIGGPHPTVLPENPRRNPGIGFRGYRGREITSVELVEALEGKRELDSVAGLSFRKNGRVAVNPLRPVMKDLDQLPLPARHPRRQGGQDRDRLLFRRQS